MEDWRGLVNGVLYVVQFRPDLGPGVVEDVVRLLLEQPIGDLTAEQEYAGIAAAVASGKQLSGGIPQPHSEDQVQDFLRRVLRRLDELRPWQPPPFRRLPDDDWPRFHKAPVLAELDLDGPASDPLVMRMGGLPAGHGERRPVLILRLRSGDDVAIVGDRWPVPRTAELRSDSRRPADEVVSAFLEHTRYDPDRVRRLSWGS